MSPGVSMNPVCSKMNPGVRMNPGIKMNPVVNLNPGVRLIWWT